MYLKSLCRLFFVAIVLLSGCESERSKKELDLREKEVRKKEEELSKLDQKLKFREQELLKREKQLDSLQNQGDTLGVYNPKLVGNWLVTMQCTETTCEGYAVGDTKTEHWDISYQDNKVLVKTIANKKVIRTYSGLFKDNGLELSAVPPPDAHTEIKLILKTHQTNDNLMEGQRIIDRVGNCRVVFSLKVEKQ